MTIKISIISQRSQWEIRDQTFQSERTEETLMQIELGSGIPLLGPGAAFARK